MTIARRAPYRLARGAGTPARYRTLPAGARFAPHRLTRRPSTNGKSPHARHAARSGGSAVFGRRRLGPADHHDQHAAFEQALAHPLHVLHGDGVNQAVALVDLVDAEVVELDLHKLLGNL